MQKIPLLSGREVVREKRGQVALKTGFQLSVFGLQFKE
jgi:hypothetical protein